MGSIGAGGQVLDSRNPGRSRDSLALIRSVPGKPEVGTRSQSDGASAPVNIYIGDLGTNRPSLKAPIVKAWNRKMGNMCASTGMSRSLANAINTLSV